MDVNLTGPTVLPRFNCEALDHQVEGVFSKMSPCGSGLQDWSGTQTATNAMRGSGPCARFWSSEASAMLTASVTC